MNTRTAPRLIAFFSASLLTLTMLASVNGLATGGLSPAQLAQVAALRQA